MGRRLSTQARAAILKDLAERRAEKDTNHSERRRYLSEAHDFQYEELGFWTLVFTLGAALYTQHSDYLVAGGGITVVAGVFAFSLTFRDRIRRESVRRSTIARSGIDDREVTEELLEQLFRNAEFTSFWLIVIGTLVSNTAGLVWRLIGWA